MKTLARGPAFSADPGQVLVVPDAFGRSLIASGQADEVPSTGAATDVPSPAPAVETAVAPTDDVEEAVSPDEAPRRPSGFRKGGRRG
ncbi:MAG: hypothetical protein RJA59_760 [Pseudomonadota bacterium]